MTLRKKWKKKIDALPNNGRDARQSMSNLNRWIVTFLFDDSIVMLIHFTQRLRASHNFCVLSQPEIDYDLYDNLHLYNFI